MNILVSWLIKQGTINDEEKELYQYAIISFIMTFSPLILAVIVGIVYFLLYMNNLDIYSVPLAIGIILTACVQLPCYFKKFLHTKS